MRVRFLTLSYSEKQVELRGDVVSVRNGRAYPRIRGIQPTSATSSSDDWGRSLLEDFANCIGTPDAISRFTQKYDPLTARLRSGQRLNTKFAVVDWLRLQKDFRDAWDKLSRPRQLIHFAELPVVAKEEFHWWFSDLSYRTANLYRLLLLELYSLPRRSLRRCVRPSCETPYFVAAHLRQKYCANCKRVVRLEGKRRWWSRNRGGDAA
jgi:hypothetical protein